MNKVRLIDKWGNVVGWQESREGEYGHGLVPHQSHDQNHWWVVILPTFFIPHDAEDRFTGIISNSVEVYENDEVKHDDGTRYSVHLVFGEYALLPFDNTKLPISLWENKNRIKVIGRAEK